MSSRSQSTKSVPGLVVHGMGCSKVVSSQVEVLLHISKSKTRARVVGFGVEFEDFLDHAVFDGREEDSQVSSDILGGIDTRVRLAVSFVLFVSDDHGATEVKAALVKLSLVCLLCLVSFDLRKMDETYRYRQ